jgi:hypothetical protein
MQMPRVRIRSGYVEFRSCHHCLMPGHLRATCPILRDEAMKQAKKEDQQKEEDILVMESAEPLPIVHDDGCLRWQNESVGQGRTDSSSVGQGRADSSSVGQGREDSSSVG